jgi:hypothetical protein
MEFEPTKVRSAQQAARVAKTENRAEYQDVDDAAYKLTLDNSLHFYEGKLVAYMEILEGRFTPDVIDTEFSENRKPAASPKRTGKSGKVGIPRGRRKAG